MTAPFSVHEPSQRALRRSLGLSMVEILISLSISALLLTACAAAFQSSFKSLEDNADHSEISHHVRGLLHRMTEQARQADAVSVTNGQNDLNILVGGGTNLEYVYQFNSTDNTIYLIINDLVASTSETHALLEDCNDAYFSEETAVDPETSVTYVKRVTAIVDYRIGDNRSLLSGYNSNSNNWLLKRLSEFCSQ